MGGTKGSGVCEYFVCVYHEARLDSTRPAAITSTSITIYLPTQLCNFLQASPAPSPIHQIFTIFVNTNKKIPQAAPGNTYLSSRLRPTRFPSSPPRRHSSPRPAQRVARPGPPAWFKCCCFGHVRARVRVRRNGRALAYAGFLRSPTRAASARARATATARAVRGVERENAPATCRLGGVEERTRERVSGGMGWDGMVGV